MLQEQFNPNLIYWYSSCLTHRVQLVKINYTLLQSQLMLEALKAVLAHLCYLHSPLLSLLNDSDHHRLYLC